MCEADLDEDVLYELQKEVLKSQRHYLCDHLQPQRLFPWLQSQNSLTMDDCEHMQSLPTTKRTVDKLIDILIKSGPGCLIKLQRAIQRSSKTQVFIADRLKKKYEEYIKQHIEQENLRESEFTTQRTPPPPYTTFPHIHAPHMELRLPDASAFAPSAKFSTSKVGTQFRGSDRLSTSVEVSNPDTPHVKPILFSPTDRVPVTDEWPSKSPSSIPSSNYEDFIRDRISIFGDGSYTAAPNNRDSSLSGKVENREENGLPDHISLQARKIASYSSSPSNTKVFVRDNGREYTSQTSQVLSNLFNEQSVEMEKHQANMRFSSNGRSFTRQSRNPDEHDVSLSYTRSPTHNVPSRIEPVKTSIAADPVVANTNESSSVDVTKENDVSPLLKVTMPKRSFNSDKSIYNATSPTSDNNYLMLHFPNSDSESFEITDDDE
nr:uncharacterized protein LOC100181150 [Ciona intestinalis]XP_018668961.1 uncharacterized protein LOC100181150 [Ciona intestinalis]|eukprot:XP_002131592.1 uncharacterized protein LOC100181150 [Ciona intestinalis]